MSKLKQCFYVIRFGSATVAELKDNQTIENKDLISIDGIAQFDKQREAKKYRRENGGIIIKGLKEVFS